MPWRRRILRPPRKKNKAPIITNANIPPTTPPAIAPALNLLPSLLVSAVAIAVDVDDEELFGDVERAAADDMGDGFAEAAEVGTDNAVAYTADDASEGAAVLLKPPPRLSGTERGTPAWEHRPSAAEIVC